VLALYALPLARPCPMANSSWISDMDQTERVGRGYATGARVIHYATSSGGIAFDSGKEGGNPFASALIEVACEQGLGLQEMAVQLCERTTLKTRGDQVPEFVSSDNLPDWTLQGGAISRQERRDALVLMVSAYSAPLPSLPGAARDERRISAMLAQNGFSVTQGIGPARSALTQALASFKRRSQRADVCVIYSTGHGLELDGEVYLLPGDYPIDHGRGSQCLKRYAVGVSQIADSASACKLNLIFFAGCRRIPSLGEQ
jgi:hypothetical protein